MVRTQIRQQNKTHTADGRNNPEEVEQSNLTSFFTDLSSFRQIESLFPEQGGNKHKRNTKPIKQSFHYQLLTTRHC